MSLAGHRKAVDLCTYCPKLCRWACPVAEAETRETVTPWALMTRVDDVLRGAAPADAATAEVWTHCTGCGRCQTACKHENDVKTVLYAARAEVQGLLPPGLLAWAEEAPAPCAAYAALPRAGRVRVLPGHAAPAVVEAGLALLAAAGFAELGRLSVAHSAHRHREAGHPAAADAAQDALAAELAGVDQLICFEAEDALALRGLKGVVHLFEALPWPDFQTLIHRTLPGDVLYLDACALGRGLELYNAPRRLLERAITGTLREATMHHTEAGCCGAGAGYAALHPGPAATVAREAAADVAHIPVVIAGGACAAHLQAALAPRPVLHLYQVLAASLRGKAQ